ncbi:hypothetical protein EDC04DRAFT_2964264 [Pisolithus marmoratus]|nr:hypothetical protein EDC04DRAFT_2964264 [Pisolithus marmoratus]
MCLGVISTLKTGFNLPMRLEGLCLNYAALLDCKNAKKTNECLASRTVSKVSEVSQKGSRWGTHEKQNISGTMGAHIAFPVSSSRRRERSTGCRQPMAQRDATKCRGTMEGGVESMENKRLGEYAHPILRYPQIGPNYPTITKMLITPEQQQRQSREKHRWKGLDREYQDPDLREVRRVVG